MGRLEGRPQQGIRQHLEIDKARIYRYPATMHKLLAVAPLPRLLADTFKDFLPQGTRQPLATDNRDVRVLRLTVDKRVATWFV
mmetsp:Transcript_11726/g.28591  ORF Transcript_11726/g.28591 Transcript_11726/m.28591 type:complete len:83 (+) Transcript_11726:294-542(+)